MEFPVKKIKKNTTVLLEHGTINQLTEMSKTMGVSRGAIVAYLVDRFYEQGFQDYQKNRKEGN
ncbi:MAG: hypothetical protein DDT41_01454 [candidate division WS2 bacterium]|nr:hypothetical protein [Candidatus Psychracetigena formicireducens]